MLWIRNSTFLLAVTILVACDKTEIGPPAEPYRFAVPAHFPQPVFDTENPTTREGIALGRMLFYDTRLSANNKVACASCHDPKLAFSDGASLSSAGVAGTTLLRHSPALFNLAWADHGLFWDGGSTNLESQAFGPLTAHDEMAQNLYELIDELNAEPAYVSGFQNAFHESISSQGVVKALAQFQRSLVSADSRYDRYRLNKPGGSLTAEELSGLNIVRSKCQGCHAGELFTDQLYHNNGLDADFSDTSHEGIYMGRFRISYKLPDLGRYKTPSLRNTALTAPYMHDGRLATLDEVLEHYATNVKASATLDPLLPAGGLQLTATEKKKVIAFLHTLTDQSFINNPDHQKPSTF